LEFVFDDPDTELKNLVFASFSDLLTGCEFKLNVGLDCCQVQDHKAFRNRELYRDQSYAHLRKVVDNDLRGDLIVFQDGQLREHEIYQDRYGQF
tara:strand:- start:1840 stop:2121 length:282 start_codon:yes stop_codon:yes gene_type:complete